MRIDSVTAIAFGPLSNETLEFGPGMTVVCGPNESAKSTWHAATFAALCGRKRGNGRPSKEDQLFADLHRPWDGTTWSAAATLTLDDGRVIKIRQDLDGKVDCRATDVLLGGRDVSAEIIFEGSPDGSVWLGLNRRSFAATACIGQTQLLNVLAEAEGLQENLQQAAATAGTDATAAGALECLETFRREHVGRDAGNSTKPLRRAIERRARAKANLSAAQEAHAEYVALADTSERCHELAASARVAAGSLETQATRLGDAADAAAEAELLNGELKLVTEQVKTAKAAVERAQLRLTRASELREELGDQPPAPQADRSALVRQIAAALGAYQNAPSSATAPATNLEALETELARLPIVPDGDRNPHPSVHTAARVYERAQAVAEGVLSRQPIEPSFLSNESAAAARTLGPQRLRELSGEVRSALGAQQDAPSVAGARAQAEQARSGRDAVGIRYATAEQDRLQAEGALRQAEIALQRVSVPMLTSDRPPPAASQDLVSSLPHSPPAWRMSMLALAVLISLVGLVTIVAVSVPVGAGLSALGAVLAGATLIAKGTAAASRTQGLPQTPVVDQDSLLRARQQHQQVYDALIAARGRSEVLGTELTAAERVLGEAKGRLSAAGAAAGRAAAAYAQVEAELTEAGLSADADALLEMATSTEQLQNAEQSWAGWDGEHRQVVAHASTAAAALLAAVAARDPHVAQAALADVPDEASAVLRSYQEACAARSEMAQQSARRPDLERQIADRVVTRGTAAAAVAARTAASAGLWSAARACGVVPEQLPALSAAGLSLEAGCDPAEPAVDLTPLCSMLEQFQLQVDAVALAQETTLSRWADLVSALEGGTLEDLTATVVKAIAELECRESEHTAAANLAGAASDVLDTACAACADALSAAFLRSAADLRVRGNAALGAAANSRELERRLAGEAGDADGVRSERARTLTFVPEAEEELSAATEELQRVRDLDSTLETTMTLLARAQERVHRDIAPLLASTLTAWLPRVTDGRYTDATVDPATLQVKVCGTDRLFRRAELLSHGTAEQVYLLLRTALTQHLTAGHDSCPLLLDDVTVQADAVRTARVLTLLHAMSEERQSSSSPSRSRSLCGRVRIS